MGVRLQLCPCSCLLGLHTRAFTHHRCWPALHPSSPHLLTSPHLSTPHTLKHANADNRLCVTVVTAPPQSLLTLTRSPLTECSYSWRHMHSGSAPLALLCTCWGTYKRCVCVGGGALCFGGYRGVSVVAVGGREGVFCQWVLMGVCVERLSCLGV